MQDCTLKGTKSAMYLGTCSFIKKCMLKEIDAHVDRCSSRDAHVGRHALAYAAVWNRYVIKRKVEEPRAHHDMQMEDAAGGNAPDLPSCCSPC